MPERRSYQLAILAGERSRLAHARAPPRYTSQVTPGERYAARLAQREARIAVLQREGERFGAARLALAAVVLVAAWMGGYAHWFPPAWIAAPIGAFALLMAAHSRQRRELALALRQGQFYRHAIARIEERWAGQGMREPPLDVAHHLYAVDLDLFGSGSLFELLCSARTAMGVQTLAHWLLGPAALDELQRRHECIEELRDKVDLRENLAVLGDADPTPVKAERLLAWAAAANVLKSRWLGTAATALPVALLGALIWGAALGQWLPAGAILVLEIALLSRLGRAIAPMLNTVAGVYDADGLGTLVKLLARIEHEAFTSGPLRALGAQLTAGEQRCSAALRTLAWIAAFAEARESLIVRWFLTVPLLYPLHVALAAERWRSKHAAEVPRWFEATGRFEALVSLAQYAYEHPDQPYPEFSDQPGVFEAQALGHPLLPQARCVRNDVNLSAAAPVLLVSGSNMSGKSTLLRAVGLNVVLAMAGAPVRANALRLAPLALGASIRVNDSLREGQSRFSAELTRLRQILAVAEGGAALLFLIDELLQGTNSTDRRIGAEGLLHALIDLGAIGMVTTHDLALTELPGIATRVRNVHLRETMRDGQMHFDYTLRAGVVTTSNGVELMRAMGLRV